MNTPTKVYLIPTKAKLQELVQGPRPGRGREQGQGPEQGPGRELEGGPGRAQDWGPEPELDPLLAQVPGRSMEGGERQMGAGSQEGAARLGPLLGGRRGAELVLVEGFEGQGKVRGRTGWAWGGGWRGSWGGVGEGVGRAVEGSGVMRRG
ncbi:hypothetical protein KFL_006110040 [Klebsormidium nitens]|uniref:Uncharacterized protein n=1 Tax=Klebsormidium nitens TaxID=105231 RepID=A0A1Y1IJ94_KLENI|nr:hypothetical protein KFL_006110040 [Klebsormidium nitens]|eukprot:GAQ90192.1 hypothetical protein KFL_006110040 [Klebsormidium nitens]